MWDLRLSNPFDRIPMRSVLLFLATMLVAIFTYIFVTAPTTYAADATWAGNAITYNGNQYIKLTDGASENNTNLPDGIHYGFIDSQQKAHILSFPAGADTATATTAEYSEYSFTPPGQYTNKSNAKQISIDAQNAANQGVNSCDSTFTFGLGWIICPFTNFLAGAMDWLFQILTGFLTVRPAQTNTGNALYRAWSVMRNFANIAFVIGFLIIIYSQLTSYGISNYGIKKILPRLIIAAILVNASYWICAIAIDISNILGYSLQDIFINLRNTIIGTEGNTWDVVSWKSLGGFILSGGTAAVAIGVGGYALAAGTVGGALFLLLPVLVGVLMAVLVALLIMAARQAIITVLVILSPLAFVAYLLPNTEKYFDKWRGLFITMLVLFPVFSVLFGGAQLAGIAIIQNADSINLIILGMAVQVAPIVVTPFLIKFSGSLLGRIAGMVNNPNKGAIDRTRKWAGERATQQKDRAIGQKDPGFSARLAQGIDQKRRIREGKQGAHKGMADARWVRSQEYSDIQQTSLEAGQLKETGETTAQTRYETAKSENPYIQTVDLETRAAKLSNQVAKETSEEGWANLQAGNTDNLVVAENIARSGLTRQVLDNTQRSQVLASSLRSAKGVQEHNFATELSNSEALRRMAGGIDPSGPGKSEAIAVSALERAKAETVKNIKEASDIKPGDMPQLRKHFDTAVENNDAEGVRAYADLMAEAGNPGIEELRNAITVNESRMSTHVATEFKAHINSSGPINSSAEDIAQWSRDKSKGDRKLEVISNDKETWSGLSATQFASMKKSSQLKALEIHAIPPEIARSLVSGPAVQNLKGPVLRKLREEAGLPPEPPVPTE
jgi:hypothetical protein